MEEFYNQILLEAFRDEGCIESFKEISINRFELCFSDGKYSIRFKPDAVKICDYSLPLFVSDLNPEVPNPVPFIMENPSSLVLSFNIFACIKSIFYPLFVMSFIKFNKHGGKIVFGNSTGKIELNLFKNILYINGETKIGETKKERIEIGQTFNYLDIFDKIYDVVLAEQYNSYFSINPHGKKIIIPFPTSSSPPSFESPISPASFVSSPFAQTSPHQFMITPPR
jgi:hypothetical protein